MNTNSVFLNSCIQEKVYVDQPSCFKNVSYPNHVFKLKKTIYSLIQVTRAWYDLISKFLPKKIQKGKVDITLFIKKMKFYLRKFMLIISFSMLLRNLCVRISPIWCKMNLKCLWLVRFHTSLDCKFINKNKAPS